MTHLVDGLRFVLFRARTSTQATAAFATLRQAFRYAKYHRLHIYDSDDATWCLVEELHLEWQMEKTNREAIKREMS